MQRFIRANNKWKEDHNGQELKGFRDVEKIYTNAQETASSIVSSLDAHCKYMKLDCVVDLLSSDDLDSSIHLDTEEKEESTYRKIYIVHSNIGKCEAF